MDDDENVSNPVRVKKEKDWLRENTSEIKDVTFAIITVEIEREINSLEEMLDQLQDEDSQPISSRIAHLQQQKECLMELLEILPVVDTKEYEQLIERDLVQLPYLDRWKVYSFWRARASEVFTAKINSLNLLVQQQTNEMKDVETIETAEIIRQADVVGITTTGAAKNRALLEHLKSKIGTFILVFYYQLRKIMHWV